MSYDLLQFCPCCRHFHHCEECNQLRPHVKRQRKPVAELIGWANTLLCELAISRVSSIEMHVTPDKVAHMDANYIGDMDVRDELRIIV